MPKPSRRHLSTAGPQSMAEVWITSGTSSLLLEGPALTVGLGGCGGGLRTGLPRRKEAARASIGTRKGFGSKARVIWPEGRAWQLFRASGGLEARRPMTAGVKPAARPETLPRLKERAARLREGGGRFGWW